MDKLENFEPEILVPFEFEKIINNKSLHVRLIRFDDDSVYLDGDVEIIFEFGDTPPWQSAIKYLKDNGYILSKRGKILSLEEALLGQSQ